MPIRALVNILSPLTPCFPPLSPPFYYYCCCFSCSSFSLLLSHLFHKKMANIHNDNSDIPERIAAARREAEALKERIKQRKEALADTTCK